MRSTSRPGLLALHLAQLHREQRRNIVDRAVRVVMRVPTAVVRVPEVADLALSGVVAERIDVEIDGAARGPTPPPKC